MATKLKVILQRTESKDFKDIVALVKAGVRVDRGLATAERMFAPTLPPMIALKAMTYFAEGDLASLTPADRSALVAAAASVKTLPPVTLFPDLSAPDASTPAENNI